MIDPIDLKKQRDRRNRAISEYAVECGHSVDVLDFLDNVRPAIEFIEAGIALDHDDIVVMGEVADHYFEDAPHLRRQYVEHLEALLTTVRHPG